MKFCAKHLARFTTVLVIGLSTGSSAFCFEVDSVWNPALEASSLTQSQFTDMYAEMLRKATGGQVKVIRPLELSVEYKNGYKGTSFLNNLWANCKDRTSRKDSVMRFLKSEIDISLRKNESVGFRKDQLVPLVKHKEYIDKIQKATNSKTGEFLTEPLGADLFVVYAFDLPNGMQLATESSLTEAHINRSELRSLATRNLYRILRNNFAVAVQDNLSVIKADDNYEASFLADAKFWSDLSKKMGDTIVMAAPSRSLVLFTTRKNSGAIQRIKQITAQEFSRGDHVISETLYAWDGKFWKPFQ